MSPPQPSSKLRQQQPGNPFASSSAGLHQADSLTGNRGLLDNGQLSYPTVFTVLLIGKDVVTRARSQSRHNTGARAKVPQADNLAHCPQQHCSPKENRCCFQLTQSFRPGNPTIQKRISAVSSRLNLSEPANDNYSIARKPFCVQFSRVASGRQYCPETLLRAVQQGCIRPTVSPGNPFACSSAGLHQAEGVYQQGSQNRAIV